MPPPKPSCYGQSGPIRCQCDAWKHADRMACTANRYFWLGAQAMVVMETKQQRQDYAAVVEQMYGSIKVKMLWKAARMLKEST